jgi:hypothetical protein
LMDIELFKLRLAETIAWCSARASTADPKHSLRTLDLLPAFIRRNAESDLHQSKPEQLRAIAEALAGNRARHLREEGKYPAAPVEDLAGGYLLGCAPNESVWDGVAEPESEGFFDGGDLAPWDTWVAAVPASERQPQGPPVPVCYVVSWVPQEFVDLVDAGIYVNPVDCIWWAAIRGSRMESDAPFLSELDQAGLLGLVPEMPGRRSL